MRFRKDCRKMEQRRLPVLEPQEENAERGLRELTLNWFTDTQGPLILRDGTIPPWFQGFISRKEAEDLVKDKPVGCFLIRLSDKAIGYILSYRGQDRCRHFVITQNKAGQLVVSGDTETHDSLANLIEYYKTCPIEPFGEKLTTSCFQAPSSEVYDVVQVDLKDRPTVSVKAVKDIWSNRAAHRAPDYTPGCTSECTPNQTPDHTSNRDPHHAPGHVTDRLPNITSGRATDRTPNQTPCHVPNHSPDCAPDRTFNHTPDCALNRGPHHDHPPALPPKTCKWRAAPTTSYDINTPPEVLPRQPRGGAALRNSLSGSQNGKSRPRAQLRNDKSNAKAQAQLTEGSLKIPPAKHCNAGVGGGSLPCLQANAQEVKPTGGAVPAMGTVYSELNLESLLLPLLDNKQGAQHPDRCTSFSPPKSSPSKRATCQTYSLLDPREHCRQPPVQGLPSSSSLDKLNINPLYQIAWDDCRWGPHSCVPAPVEPRLPPVPQQDQDTCTQVPREPPPACFVTESTYEQIPDHSFQGSSHPHPSISNTYELIPESCLRDGPHSNTYETLSDVQSKQSESSWGIKADKWRRFFPEKKKK